MVNDIKVVSICEVLPSLVFVASDSRVMRFHCITQANDEVPITFIGRGVDKCWHAWAVMGFHVHEYTTVGCRCKALKEIEVPRWDNEAYRAAKGFTGLTTAL